MSNQVRPHSALLADQLERSANLLGPSLEMVCARSVGSRSRRYDAAMRETYHCVTFLDAAYGLGLVDAVSYRRGRSLLRKIAFRLLVNSDNVPQCIECGCALEDDLPAAPRRHKARR